LLSLSKGTPEVTLQEIVTFLAAIAIFTVMATLLPFWALINQPDTANLNASRVRPKESE
jgi:hypothetical protein